MGRRLPAQNRNELVEPSKLDVVNADGGFPPSLSCMASTLVDLYRSVRVFLCDLCGYAVVNRAHGPL